MDTVTPVGVGQGGSTANIVEKHVLLSEVLQEWLQLRTMEQITDVPCHRSWSPDFGRDRRAGEVDECNGRPSSISWMCLFHRL